MTLVLPRPATRYDPLEEARRNLELEQADARSWKHTGDVDHPHSITIRKRTIFPPVTITDQDATPSVIEGAYFKTANTVATTITDFDNATEGQVIFVEFGDGNTTVDFTASGLKGNAGADWSPAQGDHMTCIYNGTDWLCDVSDNT